MAEVLKCPLTDKKCQYGRLCTLPEERARDETEARGAQGEVVDTEPFCVDERITALKALADRKNTPPINAAVARMQAGQLERMKTTFSIRDKR